MKSSGTQVTILCDDQAGDGLVAEHDQRPEPGKRYDATFSAAAMSSAIILLLLFSMKKLGPACR